MLIKTQGLVLSYLRYRETSVIARIYTREAGVQSYVVNSVRSGGRTPSRLALFQPFTLLDLVAYPAKKGGGLTRLSEYRVAYAYRTIPFDIRKSSVAMVLSEVVSRVVREEEPHDALFVWLREQLVGFDMAESGFENFPLTFLLGLAPYLGFAPRSGEDLVNQLLSGGVLSPNTARGLSLSAGLTLNELEDRFEALIRGPQEAVAVAVQTGRERRELLHLLLAYYRLHVENLGPVKSLDILSEVLGG
jgi:DNA repair protein RecO (recombination protein O)